MEVVLIVHRGHTLACPRDFHKCNQAIVAQKEIMQINVIS